ncbi:cytochrome P450, partial [Dacryopinax primogenitus]
YQEVLYKDWVIPKGTILVSNIWQAAISRDPLTYPNGDEFHPERFLTSEGGIRQPPPDTHDDFLAFGYGRRVCPGRDMAIRNLRICAAFLLRAFGFQKARGEDGKEITPDSMAMLDTGSTVYPAPFRTRIISRQPDLEEQLPSCVPK